MSINVNLGCGKDIRQGYINIDINPGNNVTVCDFRKLDCLKNDSVDYLLAVDILEYLTIEEVGDTIVHWISKLKSGGELYIKSNDSQIICTQVCYDQIDINTFNKTIFSESFKSLLNLIVIESFIKNQNVEILSKGYVENKFFIRAIKK